VWRCRQRLEDRLPDRFGDIVAAVIDFAEPAILDSAEGRAWSSVAQGNVRSA
jgi:hypothetical protein